MIRFIFILPNLHVKHFNMKNLLLLLFPAFVLFSSCRYIGGERVRGNGNITSEARTVTGFTGVKSYGSFDVYVSSGPQQSVKIEGEENLLPYIETKLEGNILKIDTKEGYWLRPRREMKIYVTSPSFNIVRLYGSGNIIGENQIRDPQKIELGISGSGDIKVNVNAPLVTAEISGSGNTILSGEARNFEGEVAGSGDIRAMDLKTEETKIEIAGSGNAGVTASQKLNVSVAGSGDVKYRGSPQVSSNIAGSGSVTKVD
jgi:hypothetical protein